MAEQGRWLRQVVQDYNAYHAVPTDLRAVGTFRHHVANLWRRKLKRRSQPARVAWKRMTASSLNGCRPQEFIIHGRGVVLLSIKPKGEAGCLNWVFPDMCGGRPALGVQQWTSPSRRSFASLPHQGVLPGHSNFNWPNAGPMTLLAMGATSAPTARPSTASMAARATQATKPGASGVAARAASVRP